MPKPQNIADRIREIVVQDILEQLFGDERRKERSGDDFPRELEGARKA